MRYSVKFVQNTDEPPLIERGGALGEMTFELKENAYISEKVSGVPRTMPINYVIL